MTEKLTRRRFLKLSTLALTQLALAGCKLSNRSYLEPEILQDAEVYGLNSSISTVNQITRLYRHLDQNFDTERYRHHERYLEVVARQSAYDSFLARREETQVNFVEWIKMHVDTLNICLKNARPPAETQTVLRRIIVIADGLATDFWDETAFRIDHSHALDVAWSHKFRFDFPRDTDASWAIADDYRVDTTSAESQSFFWSFQHEGNNLVFGWPPGTSRFKKTYEYPDEKNSLTGKDKVWLDFGLVHEWSHYLLNLPDQSAFSVHNENLSRFSNFRIVTGNNFQEPYFSPYLAHFLNANTMIPGRRRFYFEPKAADFTDRPKQITLTFQGVDMHQVAVHKVRIADSYRKPKIFLPTPDQLTTKSQFTLDTILFDDRPTTGAHLWLFRIQTRQAVKDLFLPAAAFQISKFAGRDQSASYQILFLEDHPDKKKQILEILDESQLEPNFDQHTWAGDTPYAVMKVDGSSTWLAWFLTS